MNAHREQLAEKESLADALLAIDGRTPRSPSEARKVAEKAARDARRWARILSGVTIGFLLLTIVGVGLSLTWCFSSLVPGMEICRRDTAELEQQLTAYQARIPQPDLLATTARVTAAGSSTFFVLHVVTIQGIALLLAVMLAAAACTVLLIMASRRATLRQIQVGLLDLSEQFDALQRSLQAGHSRDGGQAAQQPNA
jgi:hypothetical protein